MPNPQDMSAEKKLSVIFSKLAVIEQRLARATQLYDSNLAKAGGERTRDCNRQRYFDLANRYDEQATRAAGKIRRLRATAATLERNMHTATRMDTLAAEQAAPRILREALQQAQAAQEQASLANLSEKEARKRFRAMEHEANRKEKVERTRQHRFEVAGLDPDPRLANAHRDIDVIGLGKAAHGYVSGIASVLRHKVDRIPSRVQAWDKFDKVCDMACAGMFGSPRYDAPVNSTANPDMPSTRLEAGQMMTSLSRHIGMDGWGLLFSVIYMRFSIMEIAGKEDTDRQAVAARFRAALDGAAQFWGLTDTLTIGHGAMKILTYFDQEESARRRA